ncbi:hypothetical protein MYA_4351 [Burkholderia sp. KJ006]|nr:hypothetical protein MYA_4351 [Burkholderia sp. KJ006]
MRLQRSAGSSGPRAGNADDARAAGRAMTTRRHAQLPK